MYVCASSPSPTLSDLDHSSHLLLGRRHTTGSMKHVRQMETRVPCRHQLGIAWALWKRNDYTFFFVPASPAPTVSDVEKKNADGRATVAYSTTLLVVQLIRRIRFKKLGAHRGYCLRSPHIKDLSYKRISLIHSDVIAYSNSPGRVMQVT